MKSLIRGLIKLCVPKKNSSDTDNFPTCQIMTLGAASDAIVLQPYGLTSRPPEAGCLGLVFNIQGQQQNKIFIPFAPRLRKKGLKAGEVVFENMLAHSFFKLNAAGGLEINIPGDISETFKNITIKGLNATTTLNALNLNVTTVNLVGNLNITGTLMVNGKNIGVHQHGGVATGTHNTGNNL